MMFSLSIEQLEFQLNDSLQISREKNRNSHHILPLSKRFYIFIEKKVTVFYFYYVNKIICKFLVFTNKNDFESTSESSEFQSKSNFNSYIKRC